VTGHEISRRGRIPLAGLLRVEYPTMTKRRHEIDSATSQIGNSCPSVGAVSHSRISFGALAPRGCQ
jgi:hypothetical protein